MEKYKVVCLLTIKDPEIYNRECFQDMIDMFNKANEPEAKIEIITIDEEK